MILPTITLVVQASLTQIPVSIIHNATALGLSQWTMIRRVILPTAKAGIFTGIFLGVARALGETMAILMVCGNVVQTPSHLFDPIRTLTANIALEMAYALGNHRSTLFVSGLLLMAMVVVFVMLAEGIRHRERMLPQNKSIQERCSTVMIWSSAGLISLGILWLLRRSSLAWLVTTLLELLVFFSRKCWPRGRDWTHSHLNQPNHWSLYDRRLAHWTGYGHFSG